MVAGFEWDMPRFQLEAKLFGLMDFSCDDLNMGSRVELFVCNAIVIKNMVLQ